MWRKSGGLCPATAHMAISPCRQAGRAGGTAVCAYSQEDLEKVFEGKYKELNKESSRWTVYSGPDMNPRPGSVSAAHSGGLDFPGDNVGPQEMESVYPSLPCVLTLASRMRKEKGPSASH